MKIERNEYKMVSLDEDSLVKYLSELPDSELVNSLILVSRMLDIPCVSESILIDLLMDLQEFCLFEIANRFVDMVQKLQNQ